MAAVKSRGCRKSFGAGQFAKEMEQIRFNRLSKYILQQRIHETQKQQQLLNAKEQPVLDKFHFDVSFWDSSVFYNVEQIASQTTRLKN